LLPKPIEHFYRLILGERIMAIKTGTPGNNTLTGTASADSLFGLGGDDSLLGLAGNDKLFGGGRQ
jgi:Ca2+-binding RTX toxin-like protein